MSFLTPKMKSIHQNLNLDKYSTITASQQLFNKSSNKKRMRTELSLAQGSQQLTMGHTLRNFNSQILKPTQSLHKRSGRSHSSSKNLLFQQAKKVDKQSFAFKNKSISHNQKLMNTMNQMNQMSQTQKKHLNLLSTNRKISLQQVKTKKLTDGGIVERKLIAEDIISKFNEKKGTVIMIKTQINDNIDKNYKQKNKKQQSQIQSPYRIHYQVRANKQQQVEHIKKIAEEKTQSYLKQKIQEIQIKRKSLTNIQRSITEKTNKLEQLIANFQGNIQKKQSELNEKQNKIIQQKNKINQTLKKTLQEQQKYLIEIKQKQTLMFKQKQHQKSSKPVNEKNIKKYPQSLSNRQPPPNLKDNESVVLSKIPIQQSITLQLSNQIEYSKIANIKKKPYYQTDLIQLDELQQIRLQKQSSVNQILSNNQLGKKQEKVQEKKQKKVKKTPQVPQPENNNNKISKPEQKPQPKPQQKPDPRPSSISKPSRPSKQSIQVQLKQTQQLVKKTQRIQNLIYFIGQIPHYFFQQIKKQKKYNNKIIPLLLYKYVYDKFRQLQKSYEKLYEKNAMSFSDKQEKILQNKNIGECFVKMKKNIFKKQTNINEKFNKFIDEKDERYCFEDKMFFQEYLYKEIYQTIKLYADDTRKKYPENGFNSCFFRILNATIIIEELEFDNLLIEAEEDEELPTYDSELIQDMPENQLREQFAEYFRVFEEVIYKKR